MLRHLFLVLAMGWLATWPVAADDVRAQGGDEQQPWWYVAEDGEPRVRLRFFWTRTCPHCQRARPDVEAMAGEFDWLEVQSLELSRDTDNAGEYVRLARLVGERPSSVPAFIFCDRMVTGYDSPAGMGLLLREQLLACHQAIVAGDRSLGMGSASDAAVELPPTSLPGLGRVDLAGWSLPMVAIVLGALDSFNPCAFFVLLFLLSLMVNARSRKRMLLIGGLFVTVSGLVYFLFMAAWLNLFLVVGQLGWVTLGAGLLALAIGATNVKDFFWFKSGLSLGIPDRARPGLFQRMRALVNADRLPTLVLGTLVLAVVANAYELFCTAGFPMVFTRILTLQELPVTGYYGYLALYCLVYVVPLLAIVIAFAVTLGRRKLSEREGRILKLMSGVMMLGLGLVLVIDPGLLASVPAMLMLLGGAVGATVVIARLTPGPRGATG